MKNSFQDYFGMEPGNVEWEIEGSIRKLWVAFLPWSLVLFWLCLSWFCQKITPFPSFNLCHHGHGQAKKASGLSRERWWPKGISNSSLDTSKRGFSRAEKLDCLPELGGLILLAQLEKDCWLARQLQSDYIVQQCRKSKLEETAKGFQT